MTDSPPNIVLIMCDQMRWDAAGFAGSSTVQTPYLDRSAEGGVCFENAILCFSSLLTCTGQLAHRIVSACHLQLRNYGPRGGSQFGRYLPQYHITIGDVLKGAGYRCGLVGPWHLGGDYRSQHGFTDFWRTYRYLGDGYTDPLFDYFEQEGLPNLYLVGAEGMRLYGNNLKFGTITDPRQQRTTWTVEGSIEFIQQKHDAPFFLFASIKDPHSLILVPPELLGLYPEEQMPFPSSLRDSLDGKPEFQTRGKFRILPTITDDQFRQVMAYYYALITHTATSRNV